MRASQPTQSPLAHGVNRCAIALSYSAALAASAYGLTLARQSATHAWLGWLALVPLFWAIRTLRPTRALLCGLIWGGFLASFAAFNAADGAVPSVAGVSLLMGAPAVYSFLGAVLTRWIGFSPFVLGVGWMGVEIALGSGGVSHGLLAGTQWDVPILHSLATALGYVLVAFLVAYANAMLLAAVAGVGIAPSSTRPASRANEPRDTLAIETFRASPRWALELSRPRAPPAP